MNPTPRANIKATKPIITIEDEIAIPAIANPFPFSFVLEICTKAIIEITKATNQSFGIKDKTNPTIDITLYPISALFTLLPLLSLTVASTTSTLSAFSVGSIFAPQFGQNFAF